MWARFHYEVLTHPKTAALAEALHVPPYSASGLLACLWAWAVEKSDNGNISEYREKAIERVCGWDGNPGTFIPALLQCGWLDGSYDDDSLRIHDWMENGGAALQQSREKAAERQRHARERKSRVTVTRDCHSAKSQSQSQSIEPKKETSSSVTSGGARRLGEYFRSNFPIGEQIGSTDFKDYMRQGFAEDALRCLIAMTAENCPDHPARYLRSVVQDKTSRGIFTLADLLNDESRRESRRDGEGVHGAQVRGGG